MIQSPILRVLSTFRRHDVKGLLIGGQAAILYGAAEFSRDIDFTVLISPENLQSLTAALAGLAEENRERTSERQYWKPLREELEQLRHSRHVGHHCLTP